MKNLDTATAAQLAAIASYCFVLGAQHAHDGMHPLTWGALARLWEARYKIDEWRIGHAKKLRQVYGAGYDIERMMARINQAPPPAA